jgi:hypothetical protein
MKYRKVLSIAILFLMITGMSYAAPFSQTFRNEYQTDNIYLFITGGNVEFTQLQRIPGDWEIESMEPATLSIYGPVIDPGQRFRVKFSDSGTFTLEWAELFNGAITGSGSLFAVNGRFVDSNAEFTSQSRLTTPTTASLWLLGSGVICLFCAQRKRVTSKPDKTK